MPDVRPHARGQYLAIAIVSCAVLLFEILITRILSVALSYHFAFLAISLAMLGLAAPGVWLSVQPRDRSTLYTSLYVSAVALPLSVLAIAQLGAAQRTNLLFWIVIVLLPLTALGTSICLFLIEARGARVSRMYAADLSGAAIGAMLAVPLLSGLPTPSVVAALGLLPLAAALFAGSPRRLGALMYAALLLLSVLWGEPYRLRYSRFYIEDQPPLYEKWTPTARIAVFDKMNPGFVGWGMGLRYNGPTHDDHLWLDQDGSAGTPILYYHLGDPYPRLLAYDVVSAGYPLVQPQRACIIGGGGGRDILKALQGGAADVEVVEINPYTVHAVSDVFKAQSGDPYHLPGVHAFVGEGRNHFSRTTVPCDILEVSQIDTFAASAAGAYALSENSLYTVEAIRTFWSHLTDRGALSVSRWVAGPAWPEAVRLVLLETEALRREGIAEPRHHLLVLAAGQTANVLLFRQPVGVDLLRRARALAAERGYTLLWPVSIADTNISEVTKALTFGPDDMIRRGYDVSAPTDNRPFFFQTLDILSGSSRVAEVGTEREQSVSLLRRLVLILLVLVAVLLLLPLVARGAVALGRAPGRSTVFFASIGLAFMFIEIPLLQRLALYLGHPSYATTVVLGSLLIGAGIGAALAMLIPERGRRAAALLVPVVVGASVMLLMSIVRTTNGEPFAVRATLSITTLGIAGVMMGMPFPLGMSKFDDRDRSWYWAVNGAMGVLGSVLALVVGLLAGFTVVLGIAVGCYLLAALTLPSAPGMPVPPGGLGAASHEAVRAGE
jgi:hypothetical protein